MKIQDRHRTPENLSYNLQNRLNLVLKREGDKDPSFHLVGEGLMSETTSPLKSTFGSYFLGIQKNGEERPLKKNL